MKITVLTYLDSESESSKEYDPVVPQVARTLRRLGHRVSVLGVHGDVKRLIAGLSRRKPDLVFNLREMFGDNVFGDIPASLSTRGLAASSPSNFISCSNGMGRPVRKPCTISQPDSASQASCAACSTPSATTAIPKLCAIEIIAVTMGCPASGSG